MDKINRKIEKLRDEVTTDATLAQVRDFVVSGAPKLPSAAGVYLLEKVPIVQWLPRYSPKWLITDFIAGLTVGVMLIPQSLAYAKIATIPIANGLYSSWLPAAFAVIMGTSKDLSTGPTSILGLLTAEIVHDLSEEGFDISAIASSVALMVGVYSLVIGLFGLGFILDYVSFPVLTGFISAAALVIAFGQVGSLVGLSNVPSGVFNVIGNVLRRLPDWDGPTCGIGLGTLVILIALEKVGKKWGKRHYAIKLLANSRAVIVLVVFTLISYLVNRGRDKSDYSWKVSQVNTHGITQPIVPAANLVQKVAVRAVAPLVASTLEHLAVGKAFGRKNNYQIDQSQEFNYLGVVNIVNSFFSTMPVGGAMSRTAVASECGVKSPLTGLFTAAFILLTLYVLSPALYWLPSATLSAIIIMAVVHLFGPLSLFYRFWRISFPDFVASMVSFWVTIFVSAEIGIGVAAGWSIVWTMLRSTFVKPAIHSSNNGVVHTIPQPITRIISDGGRRVTENRTENASIAIPGDTIVVDFNDAIFFPNAERAKTATLTAIKLVYPRVETSMGQDDRERHWSVAAEKRLERIRAQRQIRLKETPLAVVVWDFTMVPYIDTSGIMTLKELKTEIQSHSGKSVQIRMVGMSDKVRSRFLRAKWSLVDLEEWREEDADLVYPSMETAIWDRDGDSGADGSSEKKG
ncbi:sulfate permease [Colletotrichum higginsianum]|uniref:Sulfate permease n=2 Tax=Colletotrichum higginsianum TaxID=80884 RepID=H1V6K1_COLHI|nr:Sulfate permease [Colletotrichum higginsianum IMI 349063]OBR14886.1 Sulfate permease [Colletotrichum higginsianum IMI 349063]TID04156.1 putative sulfate permease [Colletotrichum higginsianum]CCF35853.1 sulfate permease [Colletotrichum higginsianum]